MNEWNKYKEELKNPDFNPIIPIRCNGPSYKEGYNKGIIKAVSIISPVVDRIQESMDMCNRENIALSKEDIVLYKKLEAIKEKWELRPDTIDPHRYLEWLGEFNELLGVDDNTV